MAIETDNEKLALMSYNQPFNPAVPISIDGLTQGDLQHLIWQFPGILWLKVELWTELSKPVAFWTETTKPTNNWNEVVKPSGNWNEV